MSDLIRRDEVLETYADIYFDFEQFLPNFKKELDKIYEALQDIPTAEPKVGKWTNLLMNDGWTCSVCGYDSPSRLYNYCPNCGAKMERSE